MIECRKGILRQKYYSVFGNPAPFNERVRELPRSFKQNVDLLIYLLCYCLKGLIFVNCCRSCHVSRYRPCLQDNHKRSHPLDKRSHLTFFRTLRLGIHSQAASAFICPRKICCDRFPITHYFLPALSNSLAICPVPPSTMPSLLSTDVTEPINTFISMRSPCMLPPLSAFV